MVRDPHLFRALAARPVAPHATAPRDPRPDAAPVACCERQASACDPTRSPGDDRRRAPVLAVTFLMHVRRAADAAGERALRRYAEIPVSTAPATENDTWELMEAFVCDLLPGVLPREATGEIPARLDFATLVRIQKRLDVWSGLHGMSVYAPVTDLAQYVAAVARYVLGAFCDAAHDEQPGHRLACLVADAAVAVARFAPAASDEAAWAPARAVAARLFHASLEAR